MLAMEIGAPRVVRQPALSFTTIASMLAPTGECRQKKTPLSQAERGLFASAIA